MLHTSSWSRVLSRADVSGLDGLRVAQLLAAGAAVIRRPTLDGVLAWCDRERLGWLVLEVTGDEGTFDVWILANEDDGVVFDAGCPTPNGIAISQTVASE
jgi:hypothetical protein